MTERKHGVGPRSELMILKSATEQLSQLTTGLKLPEYVHSEDWLVFKSPNCEEGFTISILADDVTSTTVHARITNPDNLTANFFFRVTYEDAAIRACRIMSHMYSLSDAQCSTFIKEHNGLKDHKAKKQKVQQ